MMRFFKGLLGNSEELSENEEEGGVSSSHIEREVIEVDLVEIKEMIERGEEEIASRILIDSLSIEPWNSTLLNELSKIRSPDYAHLLSIDSLRGNPYQSSILESLLNYESRLFIENKTQGIDYLTTRISRVIYSKSIIDKSDSMEAISRVIKKSYSSNPFKSRDLALSLMRIISSISDSKCLEIFFSLTRNMKDQRINKLAFLASKRERRYFLSLREIGCFEETDDRDFERSSILQRIVEVLFNGSMEDIEILLADVLVKDAGYSSFKEGLEMISPYSGSIYDFLEKKSSEGTSREMLIDEIRHFRSELIGEFESGNLLVGSDYEKGNFSEDIRQLPLHSIESRIRDALLESYHIDTLADEVSLTLKDENINDRRRMEIILSFAKGVRVRNKVKALNFLNREIAEDSRDERVKRLVARLLEDLGRIEEALSELSGLEQPSSIDLLTRMEQTKKWLNDGYDLDYLGDQSEGYEASDRIFYNVHSSLPYVTSGYTIRTRGVVSKLKEKGLDISVETRWGFPVDREDILLEEEGLPEKILDSGVTYYFDPDSGGIKENKFEEFSQLAALSILERAKKRTPMAIISASDSSIGLASSMVARALKIPFIYEMRGIWAFTRAANHHDFEGSTHYNLLLRLERQCALSAETVITISEEMKGLVESWGVEESKILVVPNGIDANISEMLIETNQSEKLEKKEEPIIFGYLGSMVPYEGLENLVEAAQKLSDLGEDGIKFVVVGDGKSRQNIEDEIQRRGVEDIFELRDRIPNDEIANFYSEVDVIVLPRLGFKVCEIVPALKPLEAMAYRKCLICSDVAPMKELLTHQSNGLLFERENVNDLVEKIIFLKNNPGMISKYGEAGWETANSERSLDNLLEPLAMKIYSLLILKESQSRLPKTEKMRGLIREKILIGMEGDLDRVFEIFSDYISQCNSLRMKKNCFLAFVRAIGDYDTSDSTDFFYEFEGFSDRRSARSVITFARRGGDLDTVARILKRYRGEMDEEFTSRFKNINLKKVTSGGDIFVWPTSERNLANDRPKVACILDRFSYDSLKFEFELHSIPRKSYQEFFEQYDFDFVFMESFWGSHNGDWKFAMSSNSSPMGQELNEMIEYIKNRGLTTVFWNKEDPINYDIFIKSARRFDYIFTSDENIIPKYIEECGHDRVFPLEFACEPRLHNPIRNRLYERDLSFAGAWYERGYENRKEQMRLLLDASMNYKLDIFDRFFDDESPNKFPKKYQGFVRGSLTYDEARTTYRMYKAVLNVNTIQDSPTMFSRRVYEVMASSTCVISTPSVGVEAFENGVFVVRNKKEAKETIDKLMENKLLREKEAHLGYRNVMTNHTYKKRVKFILEKIGMIGEAEKDAPLVSLVCVSNRPSMVDNIVANFERQEYGNLELLLCMTASNNDIKKIRKKIINPRIKLVRVGKSLSLGGCLNRGFSRARGEYIGKFDDDDYYGSNYVSDQMICFDFSDADIVGKTSIFMHNGHDGNVYRRYPENSHRFQRLVLGPTILIKREVFDKVKFKDLSVGEDTNFIRDAEAQNYKIYASDPFNFLYVRQAKKGFHSWNPDQDELLKGAELIGKIDDWDELVNI